MSRGTQRTHTSGGLLWLSRAIILFTLVLLTSPLTTAGQSSLGTIIIRVSDAGTKAGIAGATTQLRDKNGLLRAVGSTDAQGYYTVQLPQGQYQLTVTALGYRGYSGNLRIRSKQSITVEVALQADGATSPTPTPTATPTATAIPTPPVGRGRIAFASQSSDYNVYTANPDGSGLINLTPNTGADHDYDPAWSPDGSRIVFVSDRSNETRYLFLMNVDGTGVTQLTSGALASDTQPAWSPDGSKIAFLSKRDFSFQIWVVNVDGTGLLQLTQLNTTQGAPSWSPDGTQIVFSCGRDLCLMNADRSQLQVWFSSGTALGAPDWSPDGSKIVFTSQAVGEFSQIWVRSVDGTTGALLSAPGARYNDREPSWSADGTQISFVSDRLLAAPHVFVMNANGSNVAQVTTADYNAGPDW